MAAFARALESAMVPPSRRPSRVPAVSLSAAMAMCVVLLLSARAPGVASSAPGAIAAPRGPQIVALPSTARQVKVAKGKQRRGVARKRQAGQTTALLDRSVVERNGLWGQRH
jgi:hypothetical protein